MYFNSLGLTFSSYVESFAAKSRSCCISEAGLLVFILSDRDRFIDG